MTFALCVLCAPVLAEKSAAEADQLAVMVQTAADTIEFDWDLGSFLAYGLASLWAAILLLRVATIPRWVNVVGVIGSLAGVIWTHDFVPFDLPLMGVLLPVNILGIIVWMIALSAVLARTGEPPA